MKILQHKRRLGVRGDRTAGWASVVVSWKWTDCRGVELEPCLQYEYSDLQWCELFLKPTGSRLDQCVYFCVSLSIRLLWDILPKQAMFGSKFQSIYLFDIYLFFTVSIVQIPHCAIISRVSDIRNSEVR